MHPNRLPIVCGAILLAALGAGCGQQAAKQAEMARAPASAPSAMYTGGPGGPGGAAAGAAAKTEASPQAPMPRKIIYTADVEIVCGDIDAAGKKLTAAVKRVGGYVSATDLAGARGEARTGTWTVRVPSDRFEDFLGEMPTLGELKRSATRSEDVSEEYYDARARLSNKRVEEERLVRHLQQTAGRLTEILQVERELSRVRGEIEQIEGRLRFLSHQTDFSTVTIALHEMGRYDPEPSPNFGTRMARTLRGSLEALADAVQAGVLMVVAVLPWLVALAAAAVPVLALARRGRGKPPVNPPGTG